MKSTRIARKVDTLGRIVVPIEMRRAIGIGAKEYLEVFVDRDNLILRKYIPSCIFCGNTQSINDVYGKMICRDCLQELRLL